MRRKILGAAVGDCVHVAGLHAVLGVARQAGFHAVMLGPAVSNERLIEAIAREQPEIVALSYRLTPEAGYEVLSELKEQLTRAGLREGRTFVFGGTPPVAAKAAATELFDRVFDGTESQEALVAFLQGDLEEDGTPRRYPDTLRERIAAYYPYPLIRHHFGQPSYEDTLHGVKVLAEAKALDVISLGVDQNTQEHFFRPEEMDPRQTGAGGVPVRTPEQFRKLYEASRCGNYPLMRSYAGTRDLLKMAQMLADTIHLAWAAIPLTWYSRLDGRSDRSLYDTIVEAQETMAWCASAGIPVEMNESHHWSLRDAHDTVAVAAAFLAAYNAKQTGVRHYVAQYMFNNPPGTSFAMDLAKMLAKVELIESLQDTRFEVWRETRVGLRSHPLNLDVAKGHLASSVYLQMALQPHIVHVVAYCEAHHAAGTDDIIESVDIARGAIANALAGMPSMLEDTKVQQRKEELLAEARVLLNAIKELAPPGVKDPWADPTTLTRAVATGLLDTPHFMGNPAPEVRGEVVTTIIDGACRAIDEDGRPLSEAERVDRILTSVRSGQLAEVLSVH